MLVIAPQFGAALTERTELERLRDLLAPLADEIEVVAQVEDPARMALRHVEWAVAEGRATGPEAELALTGDWARAARHAAPEHDPARGVFPEVQGVPHWLDAEALRAQWAEVFGTVRLMPLSLEALAVDGIVALLRDLLGVDLPAPAPVALPARPSAESVARMAAYNDILLKLLGKRNHSMPRQMWKRMLSELEVQGDPIPAGALAALSDRFAEQRARLVADTPALAAAMTPDKAAAPYAPAPFTRGFRASQYLLANMFKLQKAAAEDAEARKTEAQVPLDEPKPQQAAMEAAPKGLSPAARDALPPAAQEKFRELMGSPFRPHNRLGRVSEAELAAAYDPAPPRVLPEGRTGNVIVGCMKNEAPYILEWVAYHRAIGVDDFLIYTNGCEDGTSELLDRLQAMGILQHRNNDGWKGNSPQQYALNQSLKEPVIENADWIIHIDVDEFINVRCDNGTLQDFLARVPDATNVAMTWRLFGHNGVTRLEDRFVIEQFDTCAPKFCPKPHTVWGFKTMFRNIGAYQKLSCHRPNKLNEGFEARVRWVNGSGQDMTKEAIRNGWRSSKSSIGYDLIQLNHYALRSAESFLIKRQRGRALHVDRSIGLNYWIRMDWSDHRDITIKRNIPRVRAEYDRLMADPEVAKWHRAGLDWHRAKADELHGMPEFEELYQQAVTLKLDETERVAYALALDLES